MNISIHQAENPESFCRQVPLPESTRGYALSRSNQSRLPMQFTEGEGQAIAIGSQIAEFAGDVPVDLRADIANSYLFAQLAADRALEDEGGGTRSWYQRYVNTIASTGWIVLSNDESFREVSGSTMEVHKEIIPIVTAALGPAVTAGAIVVKVLEGLAVMDDDNPWVTLFERESQRATANQFQVSYASMEQGVPQSTLVCFELDAARAITQVLFFNFSTTDAKLTHFNAQLSLNTGIFAQTAPIVAERIRSFLLSQIAEIPI